MDVDSTVSGIEGIDELARRRGRRVAASVAALTTRAMAGEVALETVYRLRLERVRPGAKELAWLARRYLEELLPGMRGLVRSALRSGIEVRLLSGGIRQALLPLARALGLREDAVAAVEIRLDARGRYAGFDERSPLSRADGKRTLLRRIGSGRRPRTLLVGDGATDLAARPAVDAFCAFTAVVSRPSVVSGADHVARSVADLVTLLGLPDGAEPRENEDRGRTARRSGRRR
jgi:phosphoserine phosphatase